jgi:hypothetical protein
MARPTSPRWLAGAAVLLLAACGGGGGSDDSSNPPPPPGQLVADFLLPDVSPTSATTGTDVSPRDHLGHASAWYFGHAT